MKTTGFVSHHDAPRHDTGWSHPDHQGRLPAIAKAVYRDMLTLFEPLLEIEGVPATADDLRLVHTARHLDAVRETAARADAERTVLALDGVPVSGATWDAVLASAGSAITAADAVLEGRVRNAFVLARPPGRDATADGGGRFSLANTVAIAARHLRERRGIGRVVVVDWAVTPPAALSSVLGEDDGVTLVSVHQAGAGEGDVPHLPPSGGDAGWAAIPPGSGADALWAATEAGLASVDGDVGFVLLSLGLDVLAGDPLGALAVAPDDVHGLTLRLRAWAEGRCGGRLVSVLEGGYEPKAAGRATVQHLRALAGLPAA